MVEISPCTSTLGPHSLRGRVHANALHPTKVHHKGSICSAETRHTMPSTPNRDSEARCLGHLHGDDDIRDIDTANDNSWPLVDHCIVDFAGSVILSSPGGITSPLI